MRGGYPPLLEIISGPSTRQRSPVCRHRLVGDRRSTTPVLDREEAYGDCASTPALVGGDCHRYGCECLLPAEECPGQIKGGSAGGHPSQGRAIHLLVVQQPVKRRTLSPSDMPGVVAAGHFLA